MEEDVVPAKYQKIMDENAKLKGDLEFCNGLIKDLQEESSNYQRAILELESSLRPVLRSGYSVLAYKDGTWGVGFFSSKDHHIYVDKLPSLLEALKAVPKAAEENT